MQEKITLCGDNCLSCPRYMAQKDEELEHVAELWYRIGWRDKMLSACSAFLYAGKIKSCIIRLL